MPPRKRAFYTRFPVGKYTAGLREEQATLFKAKIEENVKLKGKRLKLKRLQDRVKCIGERLQRLMEEGIRKRELGKKSSMFPSSLVEKRLQSPTSLTSKGDISGSERTARRRKEQTRQAAMEIHGATPSNMAPAYCGLFASLTAASSDQLYDMCSKAPIFKANVIPKVVKKHIDEFETSHVNFVRSVNVLYRSGLVSKAKYNSIKSSLSMGSNESNTGKTHTQFMSGCGIPRLVPYKKLMSNLKAVNKGIFQS